MYNSTARLTDHSVANREIARVIDYFTGPSDTVHALVEFADGSQAEADAQDIMLTTRVRHTAAA
ncbi:MAG: hypothetical protein GX542_01665 [Rhodococcus sp.]|nr:hypothetical protein [Rhodococcus sp. (in: high G+C Gram-positive bacteria)]